MAGYAERGGEHFHTAGVAGSIPAAPTNPTLTQHAHTAMALTVSVCPSEVQTDESLASTPQRPIAARSNYVPPGPLAWADSSLSSLV
ncbi:hypothetical protein BH23ACI1_BH23ACI1_31170 [soil metagenome]